MGTSADGAESIVQDQERGECSARRSCKAILTPEQFQDLPSILFCSVFSSRVVKRLESSIHNFAIFEIKRN
jgi:hypothetical protein